MARPKKVSNVESEGKEIPKAQKNQMLTIFILVFPVLLLAMLGLVGDLILKIFLFAYEAIILKNFVDSYYGENNK